MKSWHLYLIFLLLLAGCSTTPTAPPLPTLTSSSVEAAITPSPIARPTDTASPTSTPAPTPQPTVPPTTLILWESLPAAQSEQLKADIANFSVANPNTIIQVQRYDTPEDLAAAIIDGRVDYDLLLGPATLLAPLQQTQKLQAMSDLFSASFLNGFASAALAGGEQDGELWGLPDTAGFHLLLYYNLDLVEQPPATDTQLLEVAEALTGGDQWGLVLNSREPLWVLPWIRAYGGWVVDDTGQITLNSDAVVNALTLHLAWHDVAPNVSHTEARKLFANGQAAMLIDGEWAIGELTQGVSIPWGVATLPAAADAPQAPGALVLARYWAVGSDTDGPGAEAAIRFLEAITRPERQLVWTNRFGLLPTQRAALTNPQILTDTALRISSQQLQTGYSAPLGTNINALLDAMRPPLEEMLAGSLTPEEAARQMQESAR